MLRIAALLSISAFVSLAVFDAYAVQARILLPQVVSVAWLKLVIALAIQLAVVVGTFASAVVVGARWSKTEAGLSPAKSAAPFIFLLVAGGFSASLLYNSLVCGNQSLPSVRGVPQCAP